MASETKILDFIKENKVWCFHPSRMKTRRACIEVLGRVPETVRAYLMGQKRVLLMAPGIGFVGQVNPYLVELEPGESARQFQVIVLCESLERYAPKLMIGFVAKCVAAAYDTSLNGQIMRVSPQETALSWGFSEVKETLTKETVKSRFVN